MSFFFASQVNLCVYKLRKGKRVDIFDFVGFFTTLNLIARSALDS
jgi:hypothetical protein